MHLELFGFEKYEAIHNKIRQVISQKGRAIYVFSHYHSKIKVDSCDSLPIRKILDLHNVIILIKSFFNKGENHYYYNIFLEKCSRQFAKNNNNFFSR